MAKLIANEDYRPLHKWKYQVLKTQSVKVDIPPLVVFSSPYITLENSVLTAYRGYAWDGASFIARDTPNIMRASLFHDALCQLVGMGAVDKMWRKYADKLLRRHCLEDGMSKFRAWYVYMAVRAYSRLKGM